MGLRLTTIVLALLAGVLILNAPLNAGVPQAYIGGVRGVPRRTSQPAAQALATD